jgi:predicted RecA/RadA family phage recombinase
MRKTLPAVSLLASALAMGSIAQAVQPVLQRGYDAGVSGANLAEVTLNTSNVSPTTFGLVFKLPVDDNIYAQPLYVPNVSIPGQGTHNVVYIATMSDSLFAFDADAGGAPLWSANFATRVGAVPVPMANFAFSGNHNIVGNLGILSTPVIDPSTHILYLVACTLESNTMVYRLHAVDITSGAEPYGAGVVISGSYGGSTFDAPYQTQRVSLALSGNQLVFGFGAVELEYAGGYVGWVMAYNKLTLKQSGVFATVITGNRGGGVWQSGRPPAIDAAGYAYVFSGNGWSGGGYDGLKDFSESVLKLDPADDLELVDWFTPSSWSTMDAKDQDLTSSGPMLIPGTSLLAGGGKTGVLYLLDTANLGKETATDSGVVQEESISAGGIRGGPVYWQRSAANGGPLLFAWGPSDVLKAYAFNGTTLASSPSAQSSGTQIWPGGILTLSAHADTPGSGVLWAAVAANGDNQNNPPVPGELRAFDAGNVSQELWNSAMNPSRDGFGNFAKFVPPLVINGKVYVATQSNQVAVYGLLSTYTAAPTSLAFGNQLTNTASAPLGIAVTNTGTIPLPITSIKLSTTGSQPFTEINTCGTAVAVGANCTISVVFNPATVGLSTATLSVNAGNGAGTQTVALSGTGIVPTYTASPTSLAFGNQLTNTASAPLAIIVTNTGTVALPISSVALSTNGSQPFTETNTCGASVAVGANCTISVVFNPASVGSSAATLSINAGNGAGTHTVALGGTGVVPTYSDSPASLAFGSQLSNTASAPLIVTVTNTGTLALPISSIALSTPGSQPFTETNTCGNSVAVGASCTISVVFNPASVGLSTATLSVNTGNGAKTQTVALSGTGVVAIDTVSPSSLTFGNQLANSPSAPLAVTVTNTGVVALPISSIALSTPGLQPFAQTNTCGSSVAVGANCTINVVFNPAAAGSSTATLSINAGNGGGTQTVTLSGTGVVPTYSASPTSLSFGNQLSNSVSPPQAVTLTNTGVVALPILSIGLSTPGSQPFSETNTCDSSVAVGANCVINVVFNPAAAGSSTATLSINPGNGALMQSVALSGTGIVPTVALSAAPASGGGGGALDVISLLSLLTLIGWRERLRRASPPAAVAG